MTPKPVPHKNFMFMMIECETIISIVHSENFWNARLYVAMQLRFVASNPSF